MHIRTALAIGATLSSLSAAAAGPPVRPDKPADAPVLAGSSSALALAPPPRDLVVFRGTQLINEFVYRAVLKLPAGATATPETAHEVGLQVAAFLRDSGYDLASVRATVKDDQIDVHVDEGELDKLIVTGIGWINALRLRNAIGLPLDVFNRKLFEQQMPLMAKKFGMRSYRYELWPVHLLEGNALQLDDMEELRAVPLIRPARGYELRIFAETEQWSSGFAPEIQLNGTIGLGVGGRYRLKNILQDGDRWQVHFRVGGAMRPYLDGSGSRPLNSSDYLSTRWLSRPWDGDARGLRATVVPKAELYQMQRRDLALETYKIGTVELGTGAGANLSPEYSLFFVLGMQRRWIYGKQFAFGLPVSPNAVSDVNKVPDVSNRAFLRGSAQWIFNPAELRADLRNTISLEVTANRPIKGTDSGYFKYDLWGRKLWPFGWNELRAGLHSTGEVGDAWYVDEIPLNDHLRIGFALEKFTKLVSSLSLEYRYSILRDRLKVGVFNDLGVWRHLPRDDPDERAELAGSAGGGAFFFLFDELQIDVYYGVGWSTDGYSSTGLNLQIKEAF